MDLGALQANGSRMVRVARTATVLCFLFAGFILTASHAGPALAQASILIGSFN
jgi:hypothetical protein